MSSAPYRHPEIPVETSPSAARLSDGDDMDLVPVIGLLWIVSVLQVRSAIVRGEEFGAVDSLAALALVLLPRLVRDSVYARGRRALGAIKKG